MLTRTKMGSFQSATSHASPFALVRDLRAVALLLAATLTILANSIISPGLAGIQAAFASDEFATLLVPLLVTAPSLLVAIVAPIAGWSADRFGARRQLLAGLFLFAVAGTAGLWIGTLLPLLVSRLILGIAVALIMTSQTALIGSSFKGAALTSFMGLQTAATNFSGFAFMLLAGWLAGMSPFLPFGIYAIALLYLPLMWKAFDRHGGGTETASDADQTGIVGWTWKLGGVALLAGLSQAGFYLIPTHVPFYLAQIGHAEPSASAQVLASVTLFGGIISLGYGRVRSRIPLSWTLAIGFVLFAGGFWALSGTTELLAAMIAGALIGVGTGLALPALLSVAIDLAPAGRRGIAAGAMTTAMFLGQFASPLAASPLIDFVGHPRTFILIAIMFLILGLTSLMTIPKRPGSANLEVSHA